MNVKISIITAVAENGVIGRDGDLPWRIKSELKYFKTTTIGKPVVYGRKTFESQNGPLPGRDNIVITRDTNWRYDGAIIAHDFKEAVGKAKECARQRNVGEIFIAGGSGVYAEALPVADLLYLTEVHLKPEGDTRFPDFDRSQWQEIKREFHVAKEGESADYTITVLERKLPE